MTNKTDKRKKRKLYISDVATIDWMAARPQVREYEVYAIQYERERLNVPETNRHGLSSQDIVCGAPGMNINGIILDCYIAVNMWTGIIMSRFPNNTWWFISNKLDEEVRVQLSKRLDHVRMSYKLQKERTS